MLHKCRACLEIGENMKLLSENEPGGKELIAMFISVNNFEWISNERMTSYMCNECESALKISYNFQRKCLKSHEIITKQLEKSNPELQTSKCNEVKEEITKTGRRSHFEQFPVTDVHIAIEQCTCRQRTTYKCILCPYVLETLRALSSHMSQAHKDIRDKWCNLCNELFDDLSEHRQRHRNVSKELCRFCNKEITDTLYIEQLQKHPALKSISPFECNLCPTEFTSQCLLDIHYGLLHTDNIQQEVESSENVILGNCSGNDTRDSNNENNLGRITVQHNYCGKCQKKVRSLSMHMRKIHSQVVEGLQKFICYICTRELKSNAGLKAHLKLHEEDSPYKCKYCSKTQKSRAQLIDHERIHTGEKPHICSICGKGFAQSGALGTHMRIHTGRPEQCGICQKRFCRPSELKLHLRKHSGEKPFLCTDCGKAFTQKSHLMEHMQTHSDDRPFVCAYCDKTFKQKSLLNSHLQIHSGYKPYKCKFCEYSCYKMYRLKQHMKLHDSKTNKEKVGFCPVCQKGFATKAVFNAHMRSSHNAILT